MSGIIKTSTLIISLFVAASVQLFSQGMLIAEGTTVSGSGGTIIAACDIVNNGAFENSANEFIFKGQGLSVEGTGDIMFNDVTVTAGTDVTVTGSAGHDITGRLLCDGTIGASGNLTLISGPEATAFIDGSGTGSVTGEIVMEKYFSSGTGYRYISSPFQSSPVSELADDINLSSSYPVVFAYDESRTGSGWVSYKNPVNTLNTFAGYSVHMGSSPDPKVIDIKGTVNNGEKTVTLYNHNNPVTKGFSLAGNPYPSAIDWDSETGWTRTNIDDAIYYYKASQSDPYGGEYSTYMGGVSSDGIADNIIDPMEGFFVHVTNGSFPVTGTMTINNDARVNTAAPSSAKSGEATERSLVRLMAGYTDDVNSFDPLVIYNDEKATFDFDSQLDALKLYNTDLNVANFYVFGNDGSRLSISAVPFTTDSAQILRLGIKTTKSGDVTFKIKDIQGEILDKVLTLTDTETGISQKLNSTDNYTVSLPAGEYQNRFFLNISNIVMSSPEIITDNDMFNVYSAQGILKANITLPPGETGTLTVCNLNGQIILNRKITTSGYHEFTPVMKDGIVIVNLFYRYKSLSRKLMIR